ncbi:MAG: hypothetical protein WCT03_15105 [Candidatus Obscuribacterales bacterium]|jgi:hypothetical protein
MSLLTVYVHGIGDHVSASKVKIDWDGAIFEKEMSFRSRAAFWSDIRYPKTHETGLKSMASLAPNGIWDTFSREEYIAKVVGNQGVHSPEKAKFMIALSERLLSEEFPNEAIVGRTGTKAIPLPKILRDPITKVITSLFIRDVAAYFYEEEQRQAIRQRLIDCLMTKHDDYLLVTHSMGTVIAYDVLSDFKKDEINVPLWVTIGSPLGVQEVQDRLHFLKKAKKLGKPEVVTQWLNYADRLDPVALDPTLKDDFAGVATTIVDKTVENLDRFDFTQFGPHSGTGYLRLPIVREKIIECAKKFGGADYVQEMSDFKIAKDVAHMINETPRDRVPVLIELDDKTTGKTLDEKRKALVDALSKIVSEEHQAAAMVDEMTRFVSARLTSQEVYDLNFHFAEAGAVARVEEKFSPGGSTATLTISKIWKNGVKRAL